MPREMTAAYLAAIRSAELKPAIFVEAWFTSGPIYVWNGTGTIAWGGHDWLGLGSLSSISTIEEGSSVEAKGITLTLSGIDSSLLTGILREFQVALPVRVFLGVFDDDIEMIGDPVCCFAGMMDQPTLDVDGKTSTISIACENKLIEMNVAVDRRYTNEDQQRDYPGDRGFEFVNSIQEVGIYWGRTPSGKNNL